jgi:hypothetical protein
MNGSRARLCGFLLAALTLLLGACAHHHHDGDDTNDDNGVNVYPSDYKAQIVAVMHAYLNYPTGVRDGVISEPVLKPAGPSTTFGLSAEPSHYVVCLRYDAKKNATEYAGPKELAAVFVAGRFNHFVDTPKDVQGMCSDVTFVAFPELEKLTR